MKETGRFSNSPIFVVGIYSGADKLGEGFGSSLKMAEFRVSHCIIVNFVKRGAADWRRLPSYELVALVGYKQQTGVSNLLDWLCIVFSRILLQNDLPY